MEEPEEKGNGEIPEFKDDYVAAFCALMLHKLGGMQQITLKLLDSFPEKDRPLIWWNDKTESFVMQNRAKRKRGILKIPKRIITDV